MFRASPVMIRLFASQAFCLLFEAQGKVASLKQTGLYRLERRVDVEGSFAYYKAVKLLCGTKIWNPVH